MKTVLLSLTIIIICFNIQALAAKRDTLAYTTIDYLKNHITEDTATPTDYNHFFRKMIHDGKKSGPYKIILETEQFVYYSNWCWGEKVYRYYRADRKSLESYFPDYHFYCSGNFPDIFWRRQSCASHYLDSFTKNNIYQNPQPTEFDVTFELTDSCILVTDVYRIEHTFWPGTICYYLMTSSYSKANFTLINCTITRQRKYKRKSYSDYEE